MFDKLTCVGTCFVQKHGPKRTKHVGENEQMILKCPQTKFKRVGSWKFEYFQNTPSDSEISLNICSAFCAVLQVI